MYNSTNLAAVRGDPVLHGHVVAFNPPPYATNAPWSVVERDPDEVLAILHLRFPTRTFWFGEHSGRYWAVRRRPLGRDRLWDATDPDDLAHQITQAEDHTRTPTAMVRLHPAMPRAVPELKGARASAKFPSSVCPCSECGESPRRAGWLARLLRWKGRQGWRGPCHSHRADVSGRSR